MRGDVNELLDALDLAISSAAELLDTVDLDPIARVAHDARQRAGFLGETVVVAFAGGTGSGKSSMLNALAREEVTTAGVVRPTTDHPLAWIPANPEPGLVRLLDQLGIEARVGQTRFAQLCIIDLPDMDSYDESNVEIVRDLIPRIDAVVWIFDPLKYNDRSLHTGFLRRLVPYGDQFMFVLNHVDRLTPSEQTAVRDDLWKTLVADGFKQPEVLLTAAAPGWGPPVGIDELEQELHSRFEDKQVALAKLIADLETAADALETVTGVPAAGSLEFAERWESARHETVVELSERTAGPAVVASMERVGESAAALAGAPLLSRTVLRARGTPIARALGLGDAEVAIPGGVDLVAGGGWLEAVEPMARLVTEVSVDVGGPLGAKIREDHGGEALDAELRDVVIAGQAAAGEPDEPEPQGWWRWAGYGQAALIAVIVIALLAVLAGRGGVEAGRWPAGLLVAAAAIIASLVIAGVVRSSGRAAGRRAAASYRERVERELDRSIQRRVGLPLQTTLRARAELASALATVKLRLAESTGRRRR